MLGGEEFGSGVVGRKMGTVPDGASYKILSLLGHGAKSVDVYSFGPEVLGAQGDAWSDHAYVYKPIADALSLVGRSERLLYPGNPDRGKVAIVLPGTSNFWDREPFNYDYQLETESLQYALVHDGYTVDFVDDVDLAGGALTSRGYSALYMTEPNMTAAAQLAVRDWVDGGGTLVATPGAGVADEYDSPTDTFNAVLGLQPRAETRSLTHFSSVVTDTLAVSGSAFGSGSLNLLGTIVPLVPDGATTEATLGSGGAGITLNHFGKGTAIAYGFFPGWQYAQSPSRTNQHLLPQNWGDLQRQIAAAPAELANTPKEVQLSQKMVEANLLHSDKASP
jgi:hypothetical protein